MIASAEIDDRGNPLVSLDVPNYPLAEYDAPGNHPADECPLCALGLPITAF